ncbi:MAG: hypothetical protein WCP26_09360 [Actinomycetes bacterium]
MADLIESQVWILLCVLVGVGLAILVRRFYIRPSRGPTQDDGSRFTDALTYVSGVIGILFGLLLLFTVQHYTDTATLAKEQAVSYAAAFDETEVLPPASAVAVQRGLVCVMRATATDFWAAAERGDLTGDANVLAWHHRVVKDLSKIAGSSGLEESARSSISSNLTEAETAGQGLLFNAKGNLPFVALLVIWVGTAVLSFLMALSLLDRPRLAVAMITSMTVLTLAVMAALTTFASPFTPIGPTVSPDALNAVMLRLEAANPGPIWATCERLEPSKTQ